MLTITINIGLAILTFLVEAALFGGVGFYYYRRDLRRARMRSLSSSEAIGQSK